ncbi:MAG TPA: PadR family transcriptional regulator [Actinomycetaceae bacterium]|nr:PadR family transcriptional regulator [Actinomycetaceae bacterium]
MAGRDEPLAQLRRGVLELAILALLRDEPLYGGAIIERLSEHEALGAGSGTVYPLLTRLRSSGLLVTRWEESPLGPPRKYYELTPAGRSQLAELTETWQGLVRELSSILEA